MSEDEQESGGSVRIVRNVPTAGLLPAWTLPVVSEGSMVPAYCPNTVGLWRVGKNHAKNEALKTLRCYMVGSYNLGCREKPAPIVPKRIQILPQCVPIVPNVVQIVPKRI